MFTAPPENNVIICPLDCKYPDDTFGPLPDDLVLVSDNPGVTVAVHDVAQRLIRIRRIVAPPVSATVTASSASLGLTASDSFAFLAVAAPVVTYMAFNTAGAWGGNF